MDWDKAVFTVYPCEEESYPRFDAVYLKETSDKSALDEIRLADSNGTCAKFSVEVARTLRDWLNFLFESAEDNGE